MVVLRIRVWHILVLVAACAAFLAAFQYRRGVYDPTYARLRQVRYADADGKIAAIRELIDSDIRELDLKHRASTSSKRCSVRSAMPTRLCVAWPRGRWWLPSSVTPGSRNPKSRSRGPSRPRSTEALRDPDATVRLRAASGLGQLKVTSKEGLAILLPAARTPGQPLGRFRAAGDADDRAETLWVLGFAYQDDPEALPPILEAMNDRDPQVRISGIIAMNCYLRTSDGNWYRRNADFTVPEPIAEAFWLAWTMRMTRSAHGCRCPGPAGPEDGSPGCAVVDARPWRALPTPVWIVRAVGEFGLEADQALPALRALSDDTSRAVALRFAAQKAVQAIDKEARTFHEKTLPDLIANLGDDDSEIRASAAEALARHGSRAKAAVPALRRAAR